MQQHSRVPSGVGLDTLQVEEFGHTFADLPALACVDHMLSTAWFEKSTEVDRLVSAFDRLTAQALPADASVALMLQLAADLS